jgi:hypothetical protein
MKRSILPTAGAAASCFDRLSMKLLFVFSAGDATKSIPHAEPVEARTTVMQPTVRRASPF